MRTSISYPLRERRAKRLRWLHFQRSAISWLGACILVTLVFALFRGLILVSPQLSKWSGWSRLTPSGRYLLVGTFLLGLGAIFIRDRFRRRTALVSGFWDLRMFVFDIGLLIGGVVCLLKAGSFI